MSVYKPIFFEDIEHILTSTNPNTSLPYVSPERLEILRNKSLPENLSVKERVYKLLRNKTRQERYDILNRFDADFLHKMYSKEWWITRRPNQQAPSKEYWKIWVMIGGRGSGKSKAACEYFAEQIILNMGGKLGEHDYVFCGNTEPDYQNKMIQPVKELLESRYGIKFPIKAHSNSEITYEKRGGYMKIGAVRVYCLHSGNLGTKSNGYNISQYWLDEAGLYTDTLAKFGQLLKACRVAPARGVITTTPKSGNYELYKYLESAPMTCFTKFITYENLSNTYDYFAESLRSEGTMEGEIETWAEILAIGGTLWQLESFKKRKLDPELCEEVVICVDPANSDKLTADETGIVVLGKYTDIQIINNQPISQTKFHVFADLTGRYQPKAVAEIVGQLHKTYGATFAVVETNNGGEWISSTIREVNNGQVPVKSVTAHKDKFTRAAILAEQYQLLKMTHDKSLGKLEQEMLKLTRDSVKKHSPNRVDALGWGMHYFLNIDQAPVYVGKLSSNWGRAPGVFI